MNSNLFLDKICISTHDANFLNVDHRVFLQKNMAWIYITHSRPKFDRNEIITEHFGLSYKT